eukprot:TRINITY_DN1026_c0_g1_i1.p1 TRINITY_DN1026_c0_g1~~TRINITY_DN1026_c0_g1_i1.p1  ORF type:complete len:202 (-),score=25.37 TRINITY_DN1026_c0_g1_i1:93-698(-)
MVRAKRERGSTKTSGSTPAPKKTKNSPMIRNLRTAVASLNAKELDDFLHSVSPLGSIDLFSSEELLLQFEINEAAWHALAKWDLAQNPATQLTIQGAAWPMVAGQRMTPLAVFQQRMLQAHGALHAPSLHGRSAYLFATGRHLIRFLTAVLVEMPWIRCKHVVHPMHLFDAVAGYMIEKSGGLYELYRQNVGELAFICCTE